MGDYIDKTESKSLLHKVKRIFKQSRFNPDKFKNILTGCVVSLTMNELFVYLMFKKHAELKMVPSNTAELLLLSISALEFLLAPFISFFGQKNKSRTVGIWVMLAGLFTVPFMFIPSLTFESKPDLCNSVQKLPEVKSLDVFRLILLAALGVVSTVARSGVLAHGITVLDDFKPGRCARYLANFVGLRILILIVFGDMLKEDLDSKMLLLSLMLSLQLIINGGVVLLFFRNSSQDKDYYPNFTSSLARTLKNKTFLLHGVSAGLFISALWGFTLSNNQLIEAKYRIVQSTDKTSALVNNFMHFVFIFMALLASYNVSEPIKAKFNKMAVTKKLMNFTVLSGLLLLPILISKCATHDVVGVADVYTQPNCSTTCGCSSPLAEYKPVCILDTMTTYYSPCHAGCTETKDVNNVTVLTNCSCAVSRTNSSVIYGGCKSTECMPAYQFHKIIAIFFIGIGAIVIMLHLLVIMRSVADFDKAVAMGIMLSLIALTAHIMGTLLYKFIETRNCLHWENDMCTLHRSEYANHIILTTGVIIITSLIVNVLAYVKAKKETKLIPQNENINIE